VRFTVTLTEAPEKEDARASADFVWQTGSRS
jgi:hypothetical protein